MSARLVALVNGDNFVFAAVRFEETLPLTEDFLERLAGRQIGDGVCCLLVEGFGHRGLTLSPIERGDGRKRHRKIHFIGSAAAIDHGEHFSKRGLRFFPLPERLMQSGQAIPQR